MSRFIFLTFIVFIGCNSVKKMEGYKEYGPKMPIIISSEGPYLRYFGYRFQFDTAIRLHFTYNDTPLNNPSKGVYYFAPLRDGKLKIFSISRNDTILLKEQFTKVVEPPYMVRFLYKSSGSKIEKSTIKDGFITVSIQGNDMSESIPLKYVHLKYYKNGKLTRHQIYPRDNTVKENEDGHFITSEILKDIYQIENGILIFDVAIEQKYGIAALPPAIFYIE